MQKSVHTKEYAALRKNLREIRLAAGLSQRDLAARLKVSHSWVAKVEAGERRVDLVECAWFLAACGATSKEVALRLVQHLQAASSCRTAKGAGAT